MPEMCNCIVSPEKAGGALFLLKFHGKCSCEPVDIGLDYEIMIVPLHTAIHRKKKDGDWYIYL